MPDEERGSGVGDCVDGGGFYPCKGKGMTPVERLCKFRRPGRAALTSDKRTTNRETHSTTEEEIESWR